jgi:hypothetical protein
MARLPKSKPGKTRRRKAMGLNLALHTGRNSGAIRRGRIARLPKIAKPSKDGGTEFGI